MKGIKDKLQFVADQAEAGIEELGKDEGFDIKAVTVFSANKSTLPQGIYTLQVFAQAFSGLILPAATHRVLWSLIGLSQYENFIAIDVKTIAENLNLAERTVIRATTELEELNIIIKTQHPNDKRRKDYFLNPTAFWKGNSMQRDKRIRKFQQVDKNILELPFGTIKKDDTIDAITVAVEQ